MKSKQITNSLIISQRKQLEEYQYKLNKNREDQKKLQTIIEEKLKNMQRQRNEIKPVTNYQTNPLMQLGHQSLDSRRKIYMGSVAEMYDVGFKEKNLIKLKQLEYKQILKQQVKYIPKIRDRHMRKLANEKAEVEKIMNRPQPLFMLNAQNPNISKIHGNLSWMMEDIQNEINVSNLLDDDELINGGNKVLTRVEQYKQRLKRRELDYADNQCILLESQLKGYKYHSPARQIRGIFQKETLDLKEQIQDQEKKQRTKHMLERQIEVRKRQKKRNYHMKNSRKQDNQINILPMEDLNTSYQEGLNITKINKSFNEKSQIPNMEIIQSKGVQSLSQKNRKQISQIMNSEQEIQRKLDEQEDGDLSVINQGDRRMQNVLIENQRMKIRLLNNGQQLKKLLSKYHPLHTLIPFPLEIMKQQQGDGDQTKQQILKATKQSPPSLGVQYMKRKKLKEKQLKIQKKEYRKQMRKINQKLNSAKTRKKSIQNQKIYRIILQNEQHYKKASLKRRKRKNYLNQGGQQYEVIKWRQKGRSFIQEKVERSRISQIHKHNNFNILNELSKSKINEEAEYQEESSFDFYKKQKHQKRNVKSKKSSNRRSSEKEQLEKTSTPHKNNYQILTNDRSNKNLQQEFSDINNFKQVDKPVQNKQFFPDQFQGGTPPNMGLFPNESPQQNLQHYRENSSKRTLESSQQQNVQFRPQYQPRLLQKKQNKQPYNQNMPVQMPNVYYQQQNQPQVRPQVRMPYQQMPYQYYPQPQRTYPNPQTSNRIFKVKQPMFPPLLYDHHNEQVTAQKSEQKSEFQEGTPIDEQQELEQALEEGNNSRSIEQEDKNDDDDDENEEDEEEDEEDDDDEDDDDDDDKDEVIHFPCQPFINFKESDEKDETSESSQVEDK